MADRQRDNSARHSYATTLKHSGARTEFIQESLGHTDVRTTENYLDISVSRYMPKFSRITL
ncbi:MAG: tyrosine-type recombinase/integrase [Sphingobacteriales bacterium]|nr:tyrosine-type recombinase/integrase [Sphingobacteriales bacterium]